MPVDLRYSRAEAVLPCGADSYDELLGQSLHHRTSRCEILDVRTCCIWSVEAKNPADIGNVDANEVSVG